MLPSFSNLSKGRRVILASASPRRRNLLATVGLEVEIIPSGFEETLEKSTYAKPEDYVLDTARGKAKDVMETLVKTDNKSDIVVMGCDTVVVLGEAILEKPATHDQASSMLHELSGRPHRVLTGVVLLRREAAGREWKEHAFVEETLVHFGELSSEEIADYVCTNEPMDKAGAYGYQGMASCLVDRIEGDYYNVIGLPLRRLYKECAKVLA